MVFRSLAAGLSLVMGVTVSLGCASLPEEEDEELVGQTAQAIADGYIDQTDTSVVGLAVFFPSFGSAICSGSLLAPNVVLTARHCVSDLVNGDNGVFCGVTTFQPPISPNDIFVTTQTNMPFDVTPPAYHPVREIKLLPVDNSFCGNDQAIVILSDLMPETEARPLVPRVDEPLVAQDEYYAVGYGATDDFGSGAGMRRRRDSLFINCVGEECPQTIIKPTEWEGDTGICQGDSGGPSLDLKNRVIGVTSRGSSGCDTPIYGYVYGWGDWIKETTVYAANLGGYEPPAWATGYPTDPVYSAPVGDSCETAADCASNACLSGYCTRPCTEVATCPDNYTCNDNSFCQKEKNRSSRSGSGCSISNTGDDPTTPIPWALGMAIGSLLVWRRRSRRG